MIKMVKRLKIILFLRYLAGSEKIKRGSVSKREALTNAFQLGCRGVTIFDSDSKIFLILIEFNRGFEDKSRGEYIYFSERILRIR